MKYSVLIILLYFTPILVGAQNLVPNHDFEAYDNCPTSHGEIKYLQYPTPFQPTVKDWFSPIPNSPDYFNSCTNDIWIDVPKNYYGNYPARSGNGYVAILYYTGSSVGYPTINSEYVECKLKSPLVAGVTYTVSCYVKIILSHEPTITAVMAADRISFALTDTFLSSYTSPPVVSAATPMFNNTKTALEDSTTWTKVSATYVAKGGEQYLTLGYFDDGSPTVFKQIHPAPNEPVASAASYYGIEDVSVTQRPPCDTTIYIFNATVCHPDDLPKTLTATAAAGTGYQYQWSTGDNTPTISTNQTGIYWCKATHECDIITDTFKILPINDTVTNTKDIFSCKIDTIELNPRENAISYLWNTGATSQKIKINAPGRYICTSVKDCKAYVDIYNIDRINDEFVLQPMQDTVICNGVTYKLGTEYSENVNYLWNTGATECCIVLEQPDTYILTVNTDCYSYSDTVNIGFEKCDNCLFVPDVFSPNGDGLNDTYGVKASCTINSFHLRIYNRWGQLVFQTEDVNGRWNGLIRADFAEQSAYYYFIEYTTPKDVNKLLLKGTITLIR